MVAFVGKTKTDEDGLKLIVCSYINKCVPVIMLSCCLDKPNNMSMISVCRLKQYR